MFWGEGVNLGFLLSRKKITVNKHTCVYACVCRYICIYMYISMFIYMYIYYTSWDVHKSSVCCLVLMINIKFKSK